MRDDELKRLLQTEAPPMLPESFYQRLLNRFSQPSVGRGHVDAGGVLARRGTFGLREMAVVFFVLLMGAVAWHQYVGQEDELHRIDTLSMSSLLTL